MRLRIAFFVSLQMDYRRLARNKPVQDLRRLLAAGLNGRNFSEIGREFVSGERFDIHFD